MVGQVQNKGRIKQLIRVGAVSDDVPLSELRAVPDFPGYYASPDGEVYLVSRLCFTPTTGGYPAGNAYNFFDGVWRRIRVRAHMMVCSAFNGRRPSSKHEVRHLDGSKDNSASSNLCWGTSQENTDDAERHGTQVRGERHGASILSDADVAAIRRRAMEGVTTRAIAKDYAISAGYVSKLKEGKVRPATQKRG
jgi:hypothetical protein